MRWVRCAAERDRLWLKIFMGDTTSQIYKQMEG